MPLEPKGLLSLIEHPDFTESYIRLIQEENETDLEQPVSNYPIQIIEIDNYK